MIARSFRTAAATFTLSTAVALAALAVGQADAIAKDMEPAPAASKPAAPRAETAKKVPPRAPATDDRNPYACHPKQDLACTVVHETAQGIVVVTFRPSGVKEPHVWSVVNAPGAASAGGTIYIVPGADAQPVSELRAPVRVSANFSPIID
jgi:hypothetical protein